MILPGILLAFWLFSGALAAVLQHRGEKPPWLVHWSLWLVVTVESLDNVVKAYAQHF